MSQEFYSTTEAARYLSLSVAALKYHIYQARAIHPIRVGHSFIFTQEQLDQFNLTRRPQGRPRKEPHQ